MLLHAAELVEKKAEETTRCEMIETSYDVDWASFNIKQGANIIRTTVATIM